MTAEYSRVEVQHPELKALADAVDDENEDYLARRKKREDPEGQARYFEAYQDVSATDPVQQNWDANEKEFHAKTRIFSVLAQAFEDEMGTEEGRAAVRRARLKQGEEMGKLMAQRVRTQGGQLTLNNLFSQFWDYFRWSPKVDDERYYDDDGNLVRYVLRLNCPIGDYLKEHSPDVEFAANYCDLDEYIAKAYNPNIRYSRRHWVPGGDSYSELVWELDKDGIID
jgi:hypothetical protein